MKTTIKKFRVRKEDTLQIDGYVEGLKSEYPESQISQYVVYCFGNQEYKVFDKQSD